MIVNTYQLPFDERKNYVDRMINLGIISLNMDDVLSPSLKFLQSMTNVVKNTELKDRIIKNHEPNLARIMFCSGALIDFNDMIRDYELFHMINTMSHFFNFPPIRLEDYNKLIKWIGYYFSN